MAYLIFVGGSERWERRMWHFLKTRRYLVVQRCSQFDFDWKVLCLDTWLSVAVISPTLCNDWFQSSGRKRVLSLKYYYFIDPAEIALDLCEPCCLFWFLPFSAKGPDLLHWRSLTRTFFNRSCRPALGIRDTVSRFRKFWFSITYAKFCIQCWLIVSHYYYIYC